jgi:MFS family permease
LKPYQDHLNSKVFLYFFKILRFIKNRQEIETRRMKQLELNVNKDDYTNEPSSDTVTNATPAQKFQNQGFLPVLKNRRFLILWGGQIFSQVADKVYLVLMIAIIASRFQSEEQTISGWVSAMMIAFTIPAILFGSLAGVYVDRWSKKTVLVATNLLRGGLVLAVPILLALTADLPPVLDLPVGFWILLGITFVVSTLTQFFAPAEQAAIPLLVRNRHLLPANSLYTTTMMASLILGFAVGEPLLELTDVFLVKVGVHWEFGKELVVGGAYILAGLLLLLLRTKERNLETDQPTQVWQDIWDGVQYLRKNHQVRNAMIQLVILFCIFAALAVLAVRLAEIIPGLKASQFGFLLAAGGVGMAVGAALLGQWGQSFSPTQLSLWGSCGVAAALAGLSVVSQQLWVALAMTAILGFFAALVGVPMQTTIQSQTPKAMRGKVFGLQNNAVNIALSLPLAVAGIAESFFGLKPVLFSLSAIALLGGLLTRYIAPTKSQ